MRLRTDEIADASFAAFFDWIRGNVGQAQYIYSLAAQRRLDLFIERFLDYEQQ